MITIFFPERCSVIGAYYWLKIRGYDPVVAQYKYDANGNVYATIAK